MEDNTLTTCRSVLLAVFKKRNTQESKSVVKHCCCDCHRIKNSNPRIKERRRFKFFTCKSTEEYITKKKQCKNCGKRLKFSKKLVKFSPNHNHTNILVSQVKRTQPYKNIGEEISLPKLLQSKQSGNSLHLESLNELIVSQKNELVNEGCSEKGSGNTEGLENVLDTNSTSFRNGLQREDMRPRSFYEWAIPYESIEIGELESTTPKGPVYRGRWHGDVMIYTRSNKTNEEIMNFHEEVSSLGLIRHENVVLFMGACIKVPHLAVITSVRKGQTLFTHIHIRQSSFHFASKFSIIKQIAQGMCYLHAKRITLGKLCSRNIFLESKVKIGINDYTMVNQPLVKDEYGCIPQGYLAYISPELMRTLKKDGPYLSWNGKNNQKADVFAYGTLLYEIFLEHYPFRSVFPEVVIWRVAKGYSQSLNEGEFPLSFKSIIESCWSFNESERSDFYDILSSMRKLNIPRSLQKKLSLSDSGAINKEYQSNSTLSLFTEFPSQTSIWKNS